MATTIPGGYYIGTDGKPHDANGAPLPLRSEAQDVAESAPGVPDSESILVSTKTGVRKPGKPKE